MKIGEILDKLKGLTKGDIYYWEKMGYINPQRIPKNRIDRREYSLEDFTLIKEIWANCQKGVLPKVAHQQAIEKLQQKKTSLSYASPPIFRAKKESDLDRESNNIQKMSLIVKNPAVKAVVKALNDDQISAKKKAEIEKQIISFVNWLRESNKKSHLKRR